MSKRFFKTAAFLIAFALSFSSLVMSASATIETVNSNYLGNYEKTTDPDWSWVTVKASQINLQAVYYDNKYICVVSTNGHITSNSFYCSSDSYIKCDSKGGNRKLYTQKISCQGSVKPKTNLIGVIEYIDIKFNGGDGSIYRKR